MRSRAERAVWPRPCVRPSPARPQCPAAPAKSGNRQWIPSLLGAGTRGTARHRRAPPGQARLAGLAGRSIQSVASEPGARPAGPAPPHPLRSGRDEIFMGQGDEGGGGAPDGPGANSFTPRSVHPSYSDSTGAPGAGRPEVGLWAAAVRAVRRKSDVSAQHSPMFFRTHVTHGTRREVT